MIFIIKYITLFLLLSSFSSSSSSFSSFSFFFFFFVFFFFLQLLFKFCFLSQGSFLLRVFYYGFWVGILLSFIWIGKINGQSFLEHFAVGESLDAFYALANFFGFAGSAWACYLSFTRIWCGPGGRPRGNHEAEENL